MKRILLTLLLILTILIVTSCEPNANSGNPEVGSTSLQAVITDGELTGSDGKAVTYTLDAKALTYDEDLLIQGDNTKYNAGLASFLSLLATDIYDSVVVDVVDDVTVEPNDNQQVYKDLGFSNIQEESIEGVTHYLFASQSHTVEDKTYNVVFVTIQGTSGSAEQWKSNFDVGDDSDSYYTKIGMNPEDDVLWKNKANHRGFDIAANMVKAELEEYLAAADIKKDGNTILVFTGHSRGGAIANLLGAHYEVTSDAKTFTYTFAAPTVTTDKDGAAAIATVFNIINSDDIVTALPLASWGFVHYGKVKTKSASSISAVWKSVVGANYVSAGAKKATESGFLASFGNGGRTVLYEFTPDSGNAYAIKMEATASSFEMVKESFLRQMAEDGLETFANLNFYQEDLGCTARGYICPAYLMKLLANLIGLYNEGGMSSALSYLGTYSSGFSTEYNNVLMGFMMTAITNGMRDSHAPITYVLLTESIY